MASERNIVIGLKNCIRLIFFYAILEVKHVNQPSSDSEVSQQSYTVKGINMVSPASPVWSDRRKVTENMKIGHAQCINPFCRHACTQGR